LSAKGFKDIRTDGQTLANGQTQKANCISQLILPDTKHLETALHFLFGNSWPAGSAHSMRETLRLVLYSMEYQDSRLCLQDAGLNRYGHQKLKSFQLLYVRNISEMKKLEKKEIFGNLFGYERHETVRHIHL